MRTLHAFGSFILMMAISPTLSRHVRPQGKAMWNLHGMSKCYLNYSGFAFVDYGCYCGFGGSGIPVDDADSCCMHHDQCYRDVVANKQCPHALTIYFTRYNWECRNSTAYCDANQSTCRKAVCECDRLLFACLKQVGVPKHHVGCKRTTSYPTMNLTENLENQQSNDATVDAVLKTMVMDSSVNIQ